jgi:hypothetical protein
MKSEINVPWAKAFRYGNLHGEFRLHWHRSPDVPALGPDLSMHGQTEPLPMPDLAEALARVRAARQVSS